MGKRADAIIITGGVVFVIEYKVGADDYQKHAIRSGSGLRPRPEEFSRREPRSNNCANSGRDGGTSATVGAEGMVGRPYATNPANRETLLPTIRKLLASLKSYR